MIFEVGDDEAHIGEFTRFENGCVSFVQSFDDIMGNRDFNRIVNHVRGERMKFTRMRAITWYITKNSTRSENEKDEASSMTQK